MLETRRLSTRACSECARAGGPCPPVKPVKLRSDFMRSSGTNTSSSSPQRPSSLTSMAFAIGVRGWRFASDSRVAVG
jgi:hypothetical protein